MSEPTDATTPVQERPAADRRQESPRTRRQHAIQVWWAELTEQPSAGREGGAQAPARNRRGERAELRHCSSLAEVAFCQAYLRLRSQLTAAHLLPATSSLDWLAVVAGVLAHVDTHAPVHNVGAQLGAGKEDKSVVSGARFRRLLVASEPEETLRQMRALVRLLGGTVDVGRLAEDLLGLGGPQADHTRREWAFAYYEASPDKS